MGFTEKIIAKVSPDKIKVIYGDRKLSRTY